MSKGVHFVSLGCPKNLVDSEMMLAAMVQDGHSVETDPEKAETIVVNTCGFIEDAKRESISKILEMAELKNSGRLKNLVVAGCLTQRYKDDLVDGLPEADVFIGSGQFQNIAKILKDRARGNAEKRFFNLPTYLQEETTPRINTQPRHRAYLKISEGCMKRCAFCSIPNIRGNLQSRNLSSVLSEAKLLAASGVRELNIISHDFTDYGKDLYRKDKSRTESPAALLQGLSDLDLFEWIRVLYLYPDGITSDVIRLIKERQNLVKYFDMPLQHINDRVLKVMNRRMTKQIITDTLNRIRDEIPEAVIRTQFIVGFPSEQPDEFEELVDFIKQQKFDRVGCFIYSPEEGTKGGSMAEQIDEETKQLRHNRLMSVQNKISQKKQKAWVGRTVPVLVEGLSEESELLLQGRTSQQAPDIDGVVLINDGQAKIGDLVEVKITEAHDYDLVGHIVNTLKPWN